MHSVDIDGAVNPACTCPRQACGGVTIETGCSWHDQDPAGLHHRAEACDDIQHQRHLDTWWPVTNRIEPKPCAHCGGTGTN